MFAKSLAGAYLCPPFKNELPKSMYAIVNIQGQQFKVENGANVFVHRLPLEEGKEFVIDEVLLIDDNGKVAVGSPLVSGASVKATVVSHVKGDKVIIFKKKRRKGYQKKNGHRQQFSKIEISSINQ